MNADTIVETSAPTLPPQMVLGPTHLIVADADRARTWYADNLGLVPMNSNGTRVVMGDGISPVLTLDEDRGANAPGREAGLFHVALLYPSRAELARAAMRLIQAETPIQGASDHRTHEAIYLADADGNGLELASDRPRERWPSDLGYTRGPEPLDVRGLLASIDEDSVHGTVGEGLRTGHLHLHVGDLDRALAFYRDTLGFSLKAHIGSAVFLAAGDYHHHLAANIWRGQDIPEMSDHSVGLRSWSIVLPHADDVDAVRTRMDNAGATVHEIPGGIEIVDPWQMRLRVTSAA